MLKKISSAQPDHRGFKHNLQFHESFEFQGPHGNHMCIVTEVLGYNLDYIRKLSEDGDRRLNLSLARRVSKHILCGLEYLHTVCGIVHTGKSANMIHSCAFRANPHPSRSEV